MGKILDRIRFHFNRKRFLSYQWRAIGQFEVGNNATVISPECISIGDLFKVDDNLSLQAWKEYGNQHFTPSITIGSHVTIMENCHISCCSEIIIGDGCSIGANVFITDNFHGDNSRNQLDVSPIKRPLYVKGEVHIGSNVWIGRNVCVMPGVTIGDGAVIGSNAVVTHDVTAYSVAVGVPAKMIKSVP